ncbi:uncharacterized protein LAJ45_02767 [Morchella importuna]|uniref:uncharacterized protein n=1 Tax=Morchella importuna TaxID=1174673 RepID=UPI001E8E99F4|nr:uncharacterized protein LAJ45_02767 [Morchella importuna]KAH8153180.1 hypothetical protein LAJ45_02767 [Morchella importuna]
MRVHAVVDAAGGSPAPHKDDAAEVVAPLGCGRLPLVVSEEVVQTGEALLPHALEVLAEEVVRGEVEAVGGGEAGASGDEEIGCGLEPFCGEL